MILLPLRGFSRHRLHFPRSKLLMLTVLFCVGYTGWMIRKMRGILAGTDTFEVL